MTPSATDQVRRLYDAMASTYDRIEDEPFYANQYRAYQATLDSWWPRLHGRVLDLGCGTGIQTAQLAARGARAIGIDLSTGLLREARRKVLEHRDVLLTQGDVRALPFTDGSFDAIVSLGETISHVPTPESAFAEAVRVLRRGGLFIFSLLNKWNLAVFRSYSELRAAVAQREGHDRIWLCTDDRGERTRLPLRTFSRAEVDELSLRLGLHIIERRGIHVASLLVPLRWQKRGRGPWASAFRLLGRLDRTITSHGPGAVLGYTCIHVAERI